MQIELNEIEQQLVKLVASNRYTNNRNKKIKDNKIGPQSVQETDLNGFAAELIVAKFLNIYPDLSIESRSAKNDEGDLLYCSTWIDVKWSKYKNAKLVVHPSKLKNKNHLSKYYVLVTGEFPVYEIKGYTTGHVIFKQENIKNLGYGLTYALEQDKLISIKEWL